MKRLRVGFACLARASFDLEYARDLFGQSRQWLSQLEIELIHLSNLTISEQDAEKLAEEFRRQDVDVMLIQYGTFALGTLLPMLCEAVDVPVVLWGVPEPVSPTGRLRSNSLCAINMNAHTLMRLGKPYDFVFRTPEEAIPEIERIFRVLDCVRRLRQVRLGLVGYRVPGFYTSTFDELELRKRIGVEVHHVDLAELFEEARRVDPAVRRQEAETIRGEVASVDVSEDEIEKAAALYLAFKTLVDRHHLNAFAVKCWPEFPGQYGIATCSTLGRLNAEGIVTSCEGDVYGAVTMLVEHYLTNKIPMFTDFVVIDETNNTGIVWHCGAAPICLAAKDALVQLSKHSTVDGGDKKGVVVDFPIQAGGPVTMARLSVGKNGYRMFLAGGEAVKTSQITRGNALGIRFDGSVRKLVETILGEGMEHHYVVVHADIRPELRAIAKWLDIGVLEGKSARE